MLIYFTDTLFPYRILITDLELTGVYLAKFWVNICPFKNVIFQEKFAQELFRYTHVPCTIVVNESAATLCLKNGSSVLGGRDLLTLPEYYITKEFDTLLPYFVTTLEPVDIENINRARDLET